MPWPGIPHAPVLALMDDFYGQRTPLRLKRGAAGFTQEIVPVLNEFLPKWQR
jgi:hypothetical protein